MKLKVVVNLDVIKNNLLCIKEKAKRPLLLMLKADAYGFSSVEVAKASCDIVNAFGVITIEEGIYLRQHGIEKDILLCACECDRIKDAVDTNLTISLHNVGQVTELKRLIDSGEIIASDVKVHIKLDSGMHRLGFRELNTLIDLLDSMGVGVKGVFSHLSDGTTFQKKEFDRLSSEILYKYPNAIRHLASSHSLYNDELKYDLVRVGISAYSGAMSEYSIVLDTRKVKKGERVGYGKEIMSHDTNIATVFGGYADGLFGTKRVYIDGRECKIVGNICMDTFMVDTNDYECYVGQEVLIFDRDKVDVICKDRGVSEYVLYTSTFGRIERYFDD